MVNNAPGIVGDLIRGLAGGQENTITLGPNLIISSTEVAPGSPLMRHEMGHTEQARELGILYLPTYVGLAIATALQGGASAMHANHPMEIDANRRAGLPARWPH